MLELAIGWAAAVVIVSVAYWVAGRIWKERHSLVYRVGDKRERVSGAIGEIVLVTGGALLVAGIDLASPNVSLAEMFDRRPLELAGLFVFILPWIWIHGIRTALAAAPRDRRRLMFTYLIYGVYSTIFFFGGMVMIALMVEQFFAHAEIASTRGSAILAMLAGPFRDGAQIHTSMELSYLDAQTLLSTVEESMSPVFVFATGVFVINLAIRYTPLRGLFMKNAMLMTHLTTLVAIVAIVGMGGLIYVGFYSNFIDSYLASLEAMRVTVVENAADEVDRFADIYVDMLNQKSLLGFVTRMSNEWGGVAFLLGVVQWSAQQFSRKESAASPADLTPPAQSHLAPGANV